MRYTLVRKIEEADARALSITLYRKNGLIRGWFVGPVSISDKAVDIPYLPESSDTLGVVAVVRAKTISDERKLDVCVVDPDGLWDELWPET